MKSREIGALQLRINGYNCLFLNTSRNRAYSNFSVAHELYHVLIQNKELNSFDIYREEYNDDENEMMANAFAGNILMPEDDFNATFDNYNRVIDGILQKEKEKYFKEYLLVLALANYFRTTYMSVVVRCFETHKFNIDNEDLVRNLLSSNDKEMFKGIFGKIAGLEQKNSLAEATRQDDFKDWLEEATKQGEENVRKGLLSEEDLQYRLDGMKECYREVVENHVGSGNNR
jgi:Zn-dependent peptidase ImmA (M78 family)